jgi:hypothetical protein
MHEEKKTDEHTIGASDLKKQAADGKLVLETLDRISTICSMAMADGTKPLPHHLKEKECIFTVQESVQESVASLRREHALVVARHHDLLLECGFVVFDRFMASSYQQKECLLQKYIQIRDAVRRRAHKAAMLQRQLSFVELLHDSIKNDADRSESSKPRLTQLNTVQHTRSTIQTFVGKYLDSIGSHSFLAGLYRIVDLQINPKVGMQWGAKHPPHIVRWKFSVSVLTEACCPCHGEDSDYAREAIQVLRSFLVWIEDVDLEGGGLFRPAQEKYSEFDPAICISSQSNNSALKKIAESTLSFEIDKHVSNANLRRILAVLPNPKRLEACATGSVVQVDPDNTVLRKNVDGHDDEERPWFARLDTCTVL